ncbi:hypothetical protein ACBY01_04495 [Sphingomonas sp. ac-8]|uniref:hypothetical protein n=1 Tax=Sphingomonas sp. ac-8 TaxID=3242977 RepID=UPI003A80518E
MTLTLSVEDAAALWTAAAAKTMRTSALTHEDVLDTLGACEEAEIADCLAALLLPIDLAGCRAQDLRIDAVPVLAAVPPVAALGLLGPPGRQAA